MKTTLHWTEEQICSKLQLLPLEAQIRLQRVSFYGRVVQQGTDPHWALLAAEGQWLKLLKDDLQWFYGYIRSQIYRPPPQTHPFWHEMLVHHPGTWKGFLKKAQKHVVLQQQIDANRSQLYRAFFDRLAELEWLPSTQRIPTETQDTHYICLPCKKTFATKTAWATHSFRSHGICARERFVVDQEVCGHCHHLFLNPFRLYLHLRHSTACFDALRQRGIFSDPLPSRGSTIWNSQEQFTQCPYLLADGPHLPPAEIGVNMPASISGHENDLLLDLMNLESLDSTAVGYLDVFWEAYTETVCKHPVSMDKLARVLDTWKSLVLRDLPPTRRLRRHADQQVLHAITMAEQRCSYPHICPNLILEHRSTQPNQSSEAHLDARPATGANALRHPQDPWCTSRYSYISSAAGDELATSRTSLRT